MEIDKTLLGKTGIYELRIGNHNYVGSSINLYKRLHKHYSSLKSCTHDNQYLQCSVDKYGLENLTYSILEFCDEGITKTELLFREKFHIENSHADLNLKKDPVTEQGCVTIVKTVYQFNQFGECLTKWTSISEAARYYKISESNITVACKRPKRQRCAAGFLWSYEPVYPYPLKVIYVFDLEGKYLSRHINTVDVYNTYFKDCDRKLILSQLKQKIDSNKVYRDYYLSSDRFFDISKIKTSKIDSKMGHLLYKTNPLITETNCKGIVVKQKHFLNFFGKARLIARIEEEFSLEQVEKMTEICLCNRSGHSARLKVTNLTTGETFTYKTFSEGVRDIFGFFDKKYLSIITKHVDRGTPYKEYFFTRDC